MAFSLLCTSIAFPSEFPEESRGGAVAVSAVRSVPSALSHSSLPCYNLTLNSKKSSVAPQKTPRVSIPRVSAQLGAAGAGANCPVPTAVGGARFGPFSRSTSAWRCSSSRGTASCPPSTQRSSKERGPVEKRKKEGEAERCRLPAAGRGALVEPMAERGNSGEAAGRGAAGGG